MLPKPDGVEIESGKEWEELAPATRHYHRNKDDVLEYQRERKNERKDAVWGFASEYGCVLCDEDHRVCLQFHHIDPGTKEKEVGSLANEGYAWDTIVEEIVKCTILCANCHRKVHAGVVEEPTESLNRDEIEHLGCEDA